MTVSAAQLAVGTFPPDAAVISVSGDVTAASRCGRTYASVTSES